MSCNDNLNYFAKNIFSQHGEDGILERLLDLIGTQEKYAVEFGAWDGIFLSNIRNLIVNHGYKGLFIEGDFEKMAECKENYKDNENVSCVQDFVGFIEHKKLDVFLKENNIPKNFDVLVIDIDGYDYHVWESLVDYRPRIVIIEYNASMPNDVFFVNPYSESIFMGSSAVAMVVLGFQKGYELVATTTTNCIFVVEEEYDKVCISDNRLTTLRYENHLSDGVFYQTYNKQFLMQGYKNYIWEQN